MKAALIFTVIGFLLLIFFLKLRVGEKRVEAVILKSFVSLCFIASALSSLPRLSGKDFTFGILIVGGLIFCLLGDIWLDFKYICRDKEDTFTLTGFFAFTVGHCLYISALAVRFCSDFKPYCILIPAGFAVFAFLLIRFGGKLLKVNYEGKYKLVAPFYSAIMTAFVTFSLALIILTGRKVPVLIFINIAGLFFMVSDSILNGTYFGKGKDRPVHIITNHVTYYIAQFMIAFSLCLL